MSLPNVTISKMVAVIVIDSLCDIPLKIIADIDHTQ